MEAMEANKKAHGEKNINIGQVSIRQVSIRMRKRHGKFSWEYNHFPRLVLVLKKNCLVLTKILREKQEKGSDPNVPYTQAQNIIHRKHF